LFSLYKLRIVVRERVQRLKAASIKPTFKRIVFVERPLANHFKLMLVSLEEKSGDGSDESRPSSDEVVVQMVRSVQRQVQEQQQQQQQSQQLQQQLQEQMQKQQQVIQQLTQQLQRLQQ